MCPTNKANSPAKNASTKRSVFASLLGAIFFVVAQVPLVLLLIVVHNPSYAINVLLPIAGFVVAEVFFRPAKSVQDDGAGALSDSSSLTLIAMSLCLQTFVVIGNLTDNKPFDAASMQDFSETPMWRVATWVQLLAAVVWCTALAQLKGRFTRNLEIVQDHSLLTTGIYQFVRHPGYASAYFNATCTALTLTRNPLMAALTALAVYCMYWKRIRDEEAMLIGHFGKQYVQYRAVSGDLIPFWNVIPRKMGAAVVNNKMWYDPKK